MRATKFFSAIFLAAISLAMLWPLTGAQAQFWLSGPEVLVWHGNDTGGIIPWSCENEAVAQQTASGYCAKFRKYGRITGVNRQYGDYISFDCLWAPNVERYAHPPGAMRTACYGQPRRFLTK